MAMQSGVKLVQGPPGTGKTSTITALLQTLVGVQQRATLVTAPTNIAVANIVIKLLDILHVDPWSQLLSANLCPSPPAPLLCRQQLVVVGSEERLDLSSAVDAIFLDARVRRLEEALPRWRLALRSLLLAVEGRADDEGETVAECVADDDDGEAKGNLPELPARCAVGLMSGALHRGNTGVRV